MVYKKKLSRKVKKYVKKYTRKVPRAVSGGSLLTIKRSLPPVIITNSTPGAFTITGCSSTGVFQAGGVVSGTFTDYYNLPWIMQFNLRDIDNWSSFTAMFDKFRLKKVDIKFQYGSNSASIQTPAILPSLAYCKDYDDTNYLGTEALIMDHSHSHRARLNNNKLSLKPMTATAVYGGGILSSNYMITPKGGWYTTNTPTQIFYGVKGIFEDMLSKAGSNTVVRIDVDYHLEFKDIQA